MGARLVEPAELAQARREREMCPVPRGIYGEKRIERRPGLLELAAVVVGPPERFQDRALARLGAVRPFEHDRGLGMMPASNEGGPALQQAVDALAFVVGDLIVVHDRDGRTDGAIDWVMSRQRTPRQGRRASD